MLKNTSHNVYTSTLLGGVDKIVHGYSTRALGDMRSPPSREIFLKVLGVTPSTKVVWLNQVHGKDVMAFDDDVGQVSPVPTDGAVTTKGGVMLCVHVADCVPLLFLDPVARTVGVAHAGWRGTLENITSNVIRTMEELGSKASDILVSIGPHIGMCCYDVPSERANVFSEAFGGDAKVVSVIQRRWHVDLGWANRQQLLDCGILMEHIDAPPTCTSCQVGTFFSYRKDTPETFGEILGCIMLQTKS